MNKIGVINVATTRSLWQAPATTKKPAHPYRICGSILTP